MTTVQNQWTSTTPTEEGWYWFYGHISPDCNDTFDVVAIAGEPATYCIIFGQPVSKNSVIGKWMKLDKPDAPLTDAELVVAMQKELEAQKQEIRMLRDEIHRQSSLRPLKDDDSWVTKHTPYTVTWEYPKDINGG